MQDLLEKLIYNGPLREALKELREGSVIHLVINNEIYKVIRNHTGIKLMPPSGKDKPLLVVKMGKDVINSFINERELRNIKNAFRNLYLKGNVQVKIAAPTSALMAYRAPFMLRKLGLTMGKNGD